MPFTIPAEVYIGAEKAKKIVKVFETIIDAEIVNKWAQTKFELRDELLKEFVTMKEFETKIESVRIELSKEIENAVLKIEKRLLFAVIFLNRGALEFILKILKVI
jgi:hypothetical protein